MHDLPQLWLPILATAIFVFVASSLIHMVLQWHKSDYKQLANEDAVGAALRAGSPAPGQYVIPFCRSMKDKGNEDMQKKFRDGPVGFITLKAPGPMSMGGPLFKWFLFNIAVAAFAAMLVAQAFGLTAPPRMAGHLVGMISLATYIGGSIQNGIWMGKAWRSVAIDLLDAVIYGTISAFTFMWLWPAAA